MCNRVLEDGDMNSLLLMFVCFGAFGLAYGFYGRFLSRRLFGIEPDRKTPAHTQQDGIDFVPTKRSILFGHHYTSIAGIAPMVGPGIAVIWGWLPAILWIVLGTIFLGGLHDFAALIISVRRQGKSIGEITGELISPGTRLVMLFIFFFLILVVIALFASIIAGQFKAHPASVLPIWFQIPLAVLFGWIIYTKKGSVGLWSAIMVAVMVLSVWGGWKLESEYGFAVRLNIGEEGAYDVGVWIIILLVYVYFASTLPVHRLLQPRDSINSYMLLLGMALIILGVIMAHPTMVAPAVRADVPDNTPPLIPLLFVTIACGAVSGFHSLVSSGTSSKQINSEADARFIGYGGMIAEGALAVLAVIAVGAGLGAAKWNELYSSYGGSTMGLRAFIQGTSYFMIQFTGRVGLSSVFPLEVAQVFVSVVIICFAATTLDTATRLQRYVISEIGAVFRLKAFRNRYVATGIAVGTAALLAFSRGWQTQTALLLWQIFGTINQLLAGMALLIITVYLRKKGKNIAYSVVPMVFLLFMTAWAMIWKISSLIRGRTPETIAADMVLVFIGIAALVLELFVVIFGVRALLSVKGKQSGEMEEDAAGE